jgi:hypothetical protein
VGAEITESDEIAWKSELDHVLAAVGQAAIHANGACLHAINVSARITFAEKDFAAEKRAVLLAKRAWRRTASVDGLARDGRTM